MENLPASCKKLQVMRTRTNCVLRTVQIITFSTTTFVTLAQPSLAKKDYKPGILSIAYFVESANNSINSLNSLLKKDNYRNKITTLNNPANNDLGFNLKSEILAALKPLLEKAKKTDHKKFREVIENLLSNPEENGLTPVKKFLPAASILSSILSIVGNLVITEKKITKEDLNQFMARIEQYFAQYEKLNDINEQFSLELQKVLQRSEEMKDDLKEFLVDCIYTMNRSITKESLKEKTVEALIQKYYDPQKIQIWLDTAGNIEGMLYPPDAPTTVKFLTSGIKKLQREFEGIYNDNYRELKELISSLKNTISNLDQKQLDKTNGEIDRLYNESRQADVINLNLTLVDERMNTVCRIINTGK